jgi:SAM-dependent methyltransferase
MEKKPQIPGTYDDMFKEGGYAGVFDLPYKRSPYYPLFRAVRDTLRKKKTQRVLEVGCGTGTMAHMLFDSMRLSYRGFDFSPIAVEKAKNRTGNTADFFVGDATSPATYANLTYDAVICTEVLEHIEDDLLAMSHWAPGTFCVCSVPNYDADTHVRHFRSADEVAKRYQSLLDIEEIETRRKPFLNDLSLQNWLQEVKWNRYRPDRLLWLFGHSSFDRNGGWFIFSGRRRSA